MRVGNVFSRVCLSICLSVCPSVCVTVCSGYSFWTISHRNFICLSVHLFWREGYILTISRSGFSIKVIRSRSRTLLFTYFNLVFLCIWLQVINKVKVTHQGQGQIMVIFKERCSYAGGLHSNQMHSCYTYFQQLKIRLLLIWTLFALISREYPQ